MAEPTLRELAQAVVDADDAFIAALGSSKEFPGALYNARNKAARAFGFTVAQTRTILASLDAERAQGYARAMGDLLTLLAHWHRRSAPGGDEHYALSTIMDWARERAEAAAAEKERDG